MCGEIVCVWYRKAHVRIPGICVFRPYRLYHHIAMANVTLDGILLTNHYCARN